MPTYEESSAADAAGRTGMNRRSVVKAGAAVAWSAPVISLLAAAPAYAASGPANLNSPVPFALAGVRNVATGVITFTGLLTNNNTQSTVGLQVALNLTTPTANIKGSTSTTPSGWNAPTTATSGNSNITFTYGTSTQISGNGTKAFSPVITLKTGNAACSFSAAATTTGGTGSTATGTTG